MELKDKEKTRAVNMKNLVEQKFKALESKNDATIGHAMDVKIALNNLALQAKDPTHITGLLAIDKSAAIVANDAILGSLNRKGAHGRQTPGANPQTHLASKKKASKKKKKKKKKQPLPTQPQQQPQQKPKPIQPKKKKAPKKKGKGSAQQQQKAGRAAASHGAAE
jgi:hypothetical protein